MALRISFINFWEGAFSAANNAYFLPYAFGEAFGDLEITDDIHSAEVVVSSLFGSRPVPAKKAIQYIGENVRPNLALHRFALSFDYDTFGGRNFRLPLWWWRLDWPGFAARWRQQPLPASHRQHGGEELIPIDALLQHRSASSFQDRGFCALVAANPEPLRVNLFLALQRLGTVVGYGNMFGNPLVGSKFSVLPGFRFCLCPENGIYPGYHTEKLVDAWYGGSLPLYSGDRLLGQDFNAAALVNYQDYLDTERFLTAVERLELDPEAYAQIFSQPLLIQRPSLGPLVAFLRGAVAKIRADES